MGPVFTATYTTPASGTPASSDTSTQVNHVANTAAAIKGIVAGIVGARFVETLGIGVTKGAVWLTTDRWRWEHMQLRDEEAKSH